MGGREKVVWGTEHNDCYSGFANLLLVLYTGVAYFMYLQKKLFSCFKGTEGPKSLVEYSNDWQHTAERYDGKCANFFGSLLFYTASATIWTAVLIMTPLTWFVDKVSSN